MFNIQSLIDAIEPVNAEAARDMQMIVDNIKPLPQLEPNSHLPVFVQFDDDRDTVYKYATMADFVDYCIEYDLVRAYDFNLIIQGVELDLKEIEHELVMAKQQYLDEAEAEDAQQQPNWSV